MKIKTVAASALLVLAIAGCSPSGSATQTPTGGSIAPVGSATTGSAPAPSLAAGGTPITVKDFSLDPKDVTVQEAVALAVTNAGPTVHNVAIRDASDKVVGTTKDLKTGESETLTVKLPAGNYTLFCSLPGHESLGIKGTLTVTK